MVIRHATCGLAALLAAVGSRAAPAQTAPESTGRMSWWLFEPASTHGPPIISLFNVILYLTLAVCVGVFAVLAVFLVKYRHRPGRRAVYCHGNPKLEAFWTAVPAIILVLLAAVSQKSWSTIKTPLATPSATEVQSGEKVVLDVVGMQFKWFFHYPGADGILGPLVPQKVNLNSKVIAEQIGLDRDHPGAADDFCTDTMYIPVDKDVVFRLMSVDVLHSFWIPNFYLKQDAVPGLTKRLWLRATRTSAEIVGTEAGGRPKPFDIVCAELCGYGHYTMRGMLFSVTPQQYETWYGQMVAQREYELQDL